MSRVRVDPRADPPRPGTGQAVVGAINKAFGFVAQPSRGLKKPIEKISRGGDESPSKPPLVSRGGGLGMIQCGNNPTHTCGCGLGKLRNSMAAYVSRQQLRVVETRVPKMCRV